MEPTLKQSGSRGQMTTEFALLFPVMLMIALIACNSILFLSECASFDRIFRESVCVFAPSPASEETTGQIARTSKRRSRSQRAATIFRAACPPAKDQGGLTTYTATLAFTPTIFGAYPLRRVFDVELSPIEHPITMSVDSYKPGVFV